MPRCAAAKALRQDGAVMLERRHKNEADRIAATHRGSAGMVQIKSVGVIGAGQMGAGIAHVVALGGYGVLLHDVSAERLDAGLDLIKRNMSRQVVRGIITQDAMEAGLKLIKPAAELQAIGATDLAIEAAT